MSELDALDLPDYSSLSLDEQFSRADAAASMPASSSQRSLNGHAGAGATLTPAPAAGASHGRANPLTDLIATERLYVDDLASVIKRVAAAWSRTNFPPPQLDGMFRAIEAVYRINKTLLGRLMDIGPSPSSPKLLGDLLMRWVRRATFPGRCSHHQIDELEPAYKRYSTALVASFDDDAAVQSNPKLAGILASLPPVGSTRPLPDQATTLDTLFMLPYARLRYYKKLYAKLLKSTQPGRSDHRLLVGANDKLDALVALCDDALSQAGAGDATPVPDRERAATPSSASSRPSSVPDFGGAARVTSSGASSLVGGSLPLSASQHTFSSSGVGSTSSTSIASSTAHVEDLERRLDTARTLDIFSMRPKKCRLQMQPPQLPYTRALRMSGEVHLSFVPQSDPARRDVVIRHAHLFLLTDLFLVCEPVAPAERADAAPGSDMWLLFPPLSGKHLRAERVADDDLAFDIVVMRRERLRLRCDARQTVDAWLDHLDECVRFGASSACRRSARSALSPIDLRVSSTSSSDSRSPTSPASLHASTMPRSPASDAAFHLPPAQQRAMSVLSDPAGRARSPAPLPPKPLTAGAVAALQSRQERRSSLGPDSFAPGSLPHSATYPGPLGPPPGAAGYRGPSPTPSADRMRAVSSISRRTDPGGANGHLGAPASMHRSRSADGLRNGRAPPPLQTHYRAPSSISPVGPDDDDDADDDDYDAAPRPPSATPGKQHLAAQMRCKIFLQQGRAQWKPVGTAKLRLYHQSPGNVKQLVVEQGDKPIISCIVLTDGVERVGKTGIAIELSDKGSRTGIVYMLQLKTEPSATGLFQQLLLGSDRVSVSPVR